MEKTFLAIKPDGVERGLVGQVVYRIERVGLKIIAMKMTRMDSNFSKKHYKAHVKKDFYIGLEKFMTSGPVVAMVVEGISAIEIARKIVGATEPKTAAAGTIRGDYCHHSYEYADVKGIAIKNLVHASGDEKDAEYEIKLWFKQDEMYNYNRVEEKHTN